MARTRSVLGAAPASRASGHSARTPTMIAGRRRTIMRQVFSSGRGPGDAPGVRLPRGSGRWPADALDDDLRIGARCYDVYGKTSYRRPSGRLETRMQRLTITVDDELVAEIDRVVTARGYQNRS